MDEDWRNTFGILMCLEICDGAENSLMDEDWRNTFGILMCVEICDGAGAGICDGTPWTCSSFLYKNMLWVLI